MNNLPKFAEKTLIFFGFFISSISFILITLSLWDFIAADLFAFGLSSGIRVLGSCAIIGCIMSAIGYGIGDYFNNEVKEWACLKNQITSFLWRWWFLSSPRPIYGLWSKIESNPSLRHSGFPQYFALGFISSYQHYWIAKNEWYNTTSLINLCFLPINCGPVLHGPGIYGGSARCLSRCQRMVRFR